MEKNELLAAKKLYKFLKKKRVLKAYINNVMKQHGYNDDFIKFYEKGDILNIFNLFYSSISWSFYWLDTKEGYDFWSALNDEFMQFKEEQFFDIWQEKKL